MLLRLADDAHQFRAYGSRHLTNACLGARQWVEFMAEQIHAKSEQ